MLQRRSSSLLLVFVAIVVVLLVTKQNDVEAQSESSAVFLSPIEPTATPAPKLSTQASLAIEYVSKVFQIPLSSLQIANEEVVNYALSERKFVDLTI